MFIYGCSLATSVQINVQDLHTVDCDSSLSMAETDGVIRYCFCCGDIVTKGNRRVLYTKKSKVVVPHLVNLLVMGFTDIGSSVTEESVLQIIQDSNENSVCCSCFGYLRKYMTLEDALIQKAVTAIKAIDVLSADIQSVPTESRKRGRSNDNGDMPCPKRFCNKGDSGYPGMAVS